MSPEARYAFAIGLTMFAVCAQSILKPIIGELTYFLFFPAVFISISIAGYGPGCLSIFLSAFAADYLFIEPHGVVKIFSHRAPLLRFLLFSNTSLITAEIMRRTQKNGRKLAEHLAVLKENEERFQIMATSAPVMVWISNA